MNKMMQALEAEKMVQNYVRGVVQGVLDGSIAPSQVEGSREELGYVLDGEWLNIHSMEVAGESLTLNLYLYDGDFVELVIPVTELAE